MVNLVIITRITKPDKCQHSIIKTKIYEPIFLEFEIFRQKFAFSHLINEYYK